jgi:hypothetical protein
MMKKITGALMTAAVLGLGSGCYNTASGDKKVGVPFVKDKIESRYQAPVSQIWRASKEVLSFHGTLYGENTINNTLEAKVDSRTVYVKIDEVEPGVSRIVTQARTKARLADVDLAAEIDKQIALRLK